MLRRVTIENFILIKDLELEFEEGLNVISGETGTGKSMTISAVEFVMGKQGEYPDGTAVEIELDSEEEILILRREVRGGRSRYFLNGRGTTSRVVKDLVEGRISIQGQNEFIKLLKPEFQLEMLDRLGRLEKLRSKFEQVYTQFSLKEKELKEMKLKREEALQKRDFLEYKLKEVEEIGLKPEEVDELKKRAEILKNLETVKKHILEALQYLHDADSSAYSNISLALKSLWKVAEADQRVNRLIEELSVLRDKLSDIVEELRAEDLDVSPEEIDYVNEMLFKVQRLERKYGKPYVEIIEEARRLKEELSEFYRYDDKLEELQLELEELRKELEEMGEKLSKMRREKAEELKERIEEVLRELNLEKAKVEVDVRRGSMNRYGFDSVSILFSSYGRDLKPLERVASGGELTRLFLAFSLLLPPTETYIFDEIDAGVSGETSLKLAKLLKKISRKMQIIAITHSAPVCAAADVNLVTEKKYIGDIPYIQIRRLSSEEKFREVARLMGTETENTLRGAKELVDIIDL